MKNYQSIKLLKNYFKEKPVKLAYLMGSRASGKVKPYSDTDIAVLFDPKLSSARRFNVKLEMIADLTKLLGTEDIDLIDLNSAPPFFAYEAIKQRSELFVSNEAIRIDFEAGVLARYFDAEYFLKRHSVLGLKALKEEYGISS